MGLDMYLYGVKELNYLTPVVKEGPPTCRTEDGFELDSVKLKLGYWRKHPDLHGYIVQCFGGGKDDCQLIDLEAKDIEQILAAVREDKLPYTTGFFFGTSVPEDKPGTIEILEKALTWMQTEKSPVEFSRHVFYQASW